MRPIVLGKNPNIVYSLKTNAVVFSFADVYEITFKAIFIYRG